MISDGVPVLNIYRLLLHKVKGCCERLLLHWMKSGLRKSSFLVMLIIKNRILFFGLKTDLFHP